MYDQHNGIYGALLQEYNVSRIRELNARRNEKIASLKTKADAEAYVAGVRAAIAGSFSLPERSGVPAFEITGTADAPDCRIENVIFESRPGLWVTANIYIPKNLTAPAPACLFLCGHSEDGKICDTYRTGAQTLAANGYVTLIVDPIAQGERYQFADAKNNYRIHNINTREHNMLGKQMWLTGEFFGTWRAHDALCGLDYLLSRPEVDTTRVAITGNSGGGTMTTFVQALDPRFTMAAPSCYVTSWQRNIENELPADVEQIPPGILAAGCEMGDFILAYAPRPVLLLGQKNDFFDARGLKETYESCRKVYQLLGAEENLQFFIGPVNHGYSVENRFAMYGFFSKHGNTPEISKESDIAAVPRQSLLCTKENQITAMPGKKLVYELICDEVDRLAANRKKLSLAELKELCTGKFNMPSAMPEPYCRQLRPCDANPDNSSAFFFSRFGLDVEPGIVIPMLLKAEKLTSVFFHFPETDEVTLYVPHLSAERELCNMSVTGYAFGVDVRGIGETLSLNCDFYGDNFFHAYGSDYHYNSISLMFGESLLIQRMRDLLAAIAFVKARGVKKIHLAGRGQGTLVALFTALVCEDVRSVKLFDAPESYAKMVKDRITLWPHSVMVRNILKYTDLPEIYEALQNAGKLTIVNYADNLIQQEL